MYRATTKDIEVVVEPFYLEEQSEPEDQRYVWGYHVSVTNHSARRVQLITRCWHITDEFGVVDEVEGRGVVGEEPYLEANAKFEYSSGCPLNAPSGIMTGHYQFQTDEGEIFDVLIPAFSLDLPHKNRVLN